MTTTTLTDDTANAFCVRHDQISIMPGRAARDSRPVCGRLGACAQRSMTLSPRHPWDTPD